MKKLLDKILFVLCLKDVYYCFNEHPHATIKAKNECDLHYNKTCSSCGRSL